MLRNSPARRFTSLPNGARLIGAMLCMSMVTACESHKQSEVALSPPTVKAPVEKTQLASLADLYEVPGTVASRDRVQLSSKILGRITGLYLREGDHVSKGQLVFQVDSADARARLESAQAELAETRGELEEASRDEKAAEYAKNSSKADLVLAEQQFKRYSELLARDSVSQQEFDKAEAKYKSACAQFQESEQAAKAKAARRDRVLAHIKRSQASINESSVQLGFARVVAPTDGVVVARNSNVGDIASPGSPILTVDSQSYRLEVPVDQSHVSQVRRGQEASVFVDGLGVTPIIGIVDEIVPSANPATRSVTVKLALPALVGLHSGLYGRAQFTAGTHEGIQVPLTAITRQGQLTMVYVVDANSIARLRIVKLGETHGDFVEVLSGLSPAENVVVALTDKLRDGVRVI